jgi:tetratricopeptide (TPR) repeat protein
MEIRKDPGRIITFYSYKGGTGRSMAVANVAWLLASAGKKVLMVDWDLEAPGLHRYVHPFLDDPDLTTSEGVIDFVISYIEEASSKKLDEKLDPKWFAPYANITRFAMPLDYDFPGGGTLDLIPAGKQGPTYAGRVNSFNWKDFYVHTGGRAVIEEARARMRDRYEFILIDSRTGVSDTSGICTVQLPDDVVICFTLNMQSVTGAAAAARSMLDQRPATPLHLFPVAMRVEKAEFIKTDAIRNYAKEKFLTLMSDATVAPGSRDGYWHDVEVQQIPFYAFEEQMAYFLDSPNDLKGVLGSMKSLVWHLTQVDVRNAPGPDPEVRNRILAAYAGVWSGPPQLATPEVSRQLVYFSYGEHSIPAARSANPAWLTNVGLPAGVVPTGKDVVTAADLPRTGSWMEAFRGLLRRSVAMFLVVDEHGVSPMQQRELVVALDHRARVGNLAFLIMAVPVPGFSLRQFPGLDTPNGESCPYPGLRPFNTEDAAVFFGHEAFLEKLAEQMLHVPAIVLSGKPGTGKTSAIKGGLIPKLLLQDAPHPIWKVAVCTLSGEPLACIAEALLRARGIAPFASQLQQETSELVARLSREGPGVFKELVSSVLSTWPPADRIAIVIEAGELRLDPQPQYLKSTFRDTPAVSFLIITDASDPTQIAMPALSSDDLVRAIEQPALLAGRSLEPGLAARIAAGLEGQEDSLALLQFCMTRLWQQGGGERVIGVADYEAMAGVEGAVGMWAEAIFSTLPLAEQELALRVMCQMVGISGEGTYQPRPLRSDLIPEPLREIVKKLVTAGLLIVEPAPDIPAYFLFHLRLAIRWPRLKASLAENADFLHWLDAFKSAVEEYSLRQNYSALLRGDALVTAQKWLAWRGDDFTSREVDFIRRSEQEASRTYSAMNKSNSRIILAAVLALVFVIAFVLYFHLRPESESVSSLIGAAYQNRQQNNLKSAIAGLTQSLTLHPDSKLAGQIYSDRAYCYKLAGAWENSIADLTAALATNPALADQVRLLNDRAFAYIQMRQPEAALADYTTVLKLDPQDRIAVSNRQLLTNLFTPKGPVGPNIPNFFVLMRPQNIPEGVPPAVWKLRPSTVQFLNLEGWESPIPENEVRYSDPRDQQLAQRIVNELTAAGLVVKGPVFTQSSANAPMIELWLATGSEEPIRTIKSPSRQTSD